MPNRYEARVFPWIAAAPCRPVVCDAGHRSGPPDRHSAFNLKVNASGGGFPIAGLAAGTEDRARSRGAAYRDSCVRSPQAPPEQIGAGQAVRALHGSKDGGGSPGSRERSGPYSGIGFRIEDQGAPCSGLNHYAANDFRTGGSYREKSEKKRSPGPRRPGRTSSRAGVCRASRSSDGRRAETRKLTPGLLRAASTLKSKRIRNCAT